MARKSPAETLRQIQKFIRAWGGMAPDAIFYGLTLEQFKAAVRPSEETRNGIAAAQRQIEQLTQQRKAADIKSMRLLLGVANGVRGDPKFGDDSALYAAMGYVRHSSRRKRGKKR